ncbi:MAG: lytic transglycosylase domain-containing protein [Vicinamibacteria bacterium]|nr:lytic transglycosylase domain-containing protein [Vicinamibacteria bacterium]
MSVQPERRVGLLFLITALAAPGATAQIYTRVKANGVIEATNMPAGNDFRLTYPGKGRLIHSRGFRRVAYNGEYDRHIFDAATTHGVSAELVKAVIQVESEFDHLAVSSKGAQGLMQLMPPTARRFGVGDAFDPRQNIFGGVEYLAFLLRTFQGDVSMALAGYNAGENAVIRHKGIPPYKETRGYVKKIQGLLEGGYSGPTYRRASTVSPAPGLGAGSESAHYFAPGAGAGRLRTATPTSVAARGVRIAAAAPRAVAPPLPPRTYYKWTDSRGQWHVAQEPPPEGIAYSMIRGLD